MKSFKLIKKLQIVNYFKQKSCYGDKRIVIRCRRKADAVNLCTWFDSFGLTWSNNASYLSATHWKKYKDETCYDPQDGSYCSEDYANCEGFSIFEYEDIFD